MSDGGLRYRTNDGFGSLRVYPGICQLPRKDLYEERTKIDNQREVATDLVSLILQFSLPTTIQTNEWRFGIDR